LPMMVEKRQLVTPGEVLAEGDFVAGENTAVEGGKIYTTVVGLAQVEGKTVYVTALKGCYVPIPDDLVIGKVIDVGLSEWILDINSPYNGVLHASDVMGRSFKPQRDELTSVFSLGDMIIAKVVSFDRTRNPSLSVSGPGLGPITRGHIMKITPAKIPRLIGKKGSMVNLIKTETGCRIAVGQNGRVLVAGRNAEDEALAIMAVRMIEREAHTTGLTDRVHAMLVEEKSKRGGMNA